MILKFGASRLFRKRRLAILRPNGILCSRWLCPLLGLALLAGRPAIAQENLASEYQLKAAFLFNFSKFIDWPADSFPNSKSPFTICILGPDPFGRVLDEELNGKELADRPIAVRRCQTQAEARACQIVFVSRQEANRLPEILQVLRGTNALVVGESEGFAAGGGTIEFFLQEDRVRFRINPDAAARAGLTISSKLLALAMIVRGEPNGKS
jgi:hypothetical protein